VPKPGIYAMMQAAQGGSIMEKQPNSRMCFRDVFRVRHRPAQGRHRPAPALLHRRRGAAASPGSGRSRSTRGIRGIYMGGLSALYWTSQLKFLCTLAFSRY